MRDFANLNLYGRRRENLCGGGNIGVVPLLTPPKIVVADQKQSDLSVKVNVLHFFCVNAIEATLMSTMKSEIGLQ